MGGAGAEAVEHSTLGLHCYLPEARSHGPDHGQLHHWHYYHEIPDSSERRQPPRIRGRAPTWKGGLKEMIHLIRDKDKASMISWSIFLNYYPIIY
jgi:hypothetical protein